MAHVPDAVRTLDRDLRELFGHRLKSVVAYGSTNISHSARLSRSPIV
jgi:hypothetical protein